MKKRIFGLFLALIAFSLCTALQAKERGSPSGVTKMKIEEVITINPAAAIELQTIQETACFACPDQCTYQDLDECIPEATANLTAQPKVQTFRQKFAVNYLCYKQNQTTGYVPAAFQTRNCAKGYIRA